MGLDQNPSDNSLIFKWSLTRSYFSRNSFATNLCLNLGPVKARRTCRDPETQGGFSTHSRKSQQILQVLGAAARERCNEHDTKSWECDADQLGQHQQRVQVEKVFDFFIKSNPRERIGESTRARDLLQSHLVEAGREATRLRRRIRELKSNLHDKLAPVKVGILKMSPRLSLAKMFQVTQTRLEHRSHRPVNEACADSVHSR